MKKILYILIFQLMVNSLAAQAYIQFNTGYSFATNPSIHQNRVVADSVMSLFRIRFGYGKGLNIGFSGGYRFNDHISAEIMITTAFFTASISNNNWEKYFVRDYQQLHLSGLNGDARMTNASVQVSPMIVYSVQAGKFEPYIKAGINFLYLKSNYENDYTYKYTDETNNYYLENTKLKREYTGPLCLGFRGSFGARYPLSDHLVVLAEFMAVNSAYRFRKSETVSYAVNGEDHLVELTNNPEKLRGNDGLVDFSNVGINVGIRMSW